MHKKKFNINFFILTALAVVFLAACGGGGSSPTPTTYFTLPDTFGMQTYLDAVANALGSGTYGTPIKFNFQGSSGVFGMVDDYFSLINTALIPGGEGRITSTTAYGELKSDFVYLETVSADINLDGTTQQITCSRKSTAPACALMWMGGQPFALLIVTAEPSATDDGKGTVIMNPNLIGAAAANTNVAFTWNTTTSASKKYQYQAVGELATGIVATKAKYYFQQNSTLNPVQFVMKGSGKWSTNPSTGCTQSIAKFGWQDQAAYISTGFDATSVCPAVPAGVACVQESTAEAVADANCVVSVSSETYFGINSFNASDARLPSSFPASPTF